WERGSGGEGYPWKAILTKRIPTQAGLGGGSSDAATALKLLAVWAKRWDLPVPDLQALAVQLGADVAFFVGGDADATRGALVASVSPPTALCALARGKGETLTPLPILPRLWWVIAKPYGVGAPTAWAYAQLQRSAYQRSTRAYRTERLVNALQRGAIKTPADLASLLHNDFDEPILNALPELRSLRQRMEQPGVLKVVLCGSGAAQAALCNSHEQAKKLANSLIEQGYWAVAVTNL
ncbi:MAG: hypothetical protein N2651_02265, partial [Fimbriimonadales bacterium]|nr:hypothetical protein [Fimbriimonadales bacterium]